LPISALYMIFDKQGVWFTFSMILLISRVVALVIGGTYGGPEFALGLFSFTGILFWLWNNAYLLNLAGINKRESVEVLIKYTTIGVIVSIPLILLKVFSVNFYVIFLAAGIITPIYYGITLHNDPTFKKGNRLFSEKLYKNESFLLVTLLTRDGESRKPKRDHKDNESLKLLKKLLSSFSPNNPGLNKFLISDLEPIRKVSNAC
jgi:hypothetical protein